LLEDGLPEGSPSFGDLASASLWWADTDEAVVKKMLCGMLATGPETGRGVVYAIPFFYRKHRRIFWFCHTLCEQTQREFQRFKEKEPSRPFKKVFMFKTTDLRDLMKVQQIILRAPVNVSVPTN
jgi:hypothetical protein